MEAKGAKGRRDRHNFRLHQIYQCGCASSKKSLNPTLIFNPLTLLSFHVLCSLIASLPSIPSLISSNLLSEVNHFHTSIVCPFISLPLLLLHYTFLAKPQPRWIQLFAYSMRESAQLYVAGTKHKTMLGGLNDHVHYLLFFSLFTYVVDPLPDTAVGCSRVDKNPCPHGACILVQDRQ